MKRVDLRELSNLITGDIRRFERGELPLTQNNLDRLRTMEAVLKRRRLAYKENYARFCHEMDQILWSIDDKITLLEARMPALPPGLEDLDNLDLGRVRAPFPAA